MKLEKKHAVSCLEFILEYLENGYYPVDDTVNESGMISKIFGFGKHQKLIETDVISAWVKARELPKVKNTARLDLTSAEGCAMLDMMAEVFRDGNHEVELTPGYKRLRTYLDKEFVINADDLENQERENEFISFLFG